ncbi:MAG TPA: protein-L-isoaspartate(D-aspartate) O-methyltransferase [Phycisphaerae bacterium]|nr:protein-L-isoaspartate(D-aspartate) O-methyltransferase [Phycisphaerae bacterium]
MGSTEEKLADARQSMVEHQLRRRGIRNQALLDAFSSIPREVFLPDDLYDEAYEDRPVSIGMGQTISQPYVTALMVQHLDLQPAHRVLDVGLGSGYQAAILARLSRHVYAIERIEELTERAMGVLARLEVRNITICTGDGSLGWPEEAPFDRIICGAAAPDIPQPWIDQLGEGGRIVAPIGGPDVQTVVVVQKENGKVRRQQVCDVRFVKLIGRKGWPS